MKAEQERRRRQQELQEEELRALGAKLAKSAINTLLVGTASDYSEAKYAVDAMTSLCVHDMTVSGYAPMFPPLCAESDEAMIVLANHQSDIDQYLLNFCLNYAMDQHVKKNSSHNHNEKNKHSEHEIRVLRNKSVENNAQALDSSTTEAGGIFEWLKSMWPGASSSVSAAPPTVPTAATRLRTRSSGVPGVRATAFTHRHFERMPIVGPYVGRFLIGLEKGDTTDSIRRKIRQKRKMFNPNVWVLFPEGRILDVDAVEQCKQFWFQQQEFLGVKIPSSPSCAHHVEQPQKQEENSNSNSSSSTAAKATPESFYPWKRLLYPRFVAYEALVKELGPRLRYVVDCTITYPQAQHAAFHEQTWSYLRYPSLFYYLVFHPHAPSPHIHFRCYTVRTAQDRERVASREFLVHLWRKKNVRMNQAL